jgi:hypothetical protein
MPIILNEQDSRRDHLSGGAGGGAIQIDSDYTTASDVAVIHHVTAGHVDSVWVQVHNTTNQNVHLFLVLNPSDDTSTAAIDAVTTEIVIPAHDSLWVLQGDSFRLRGTNTSTITAYVGATHTDDLRATGYVVRTKGESIY